jgi:two-component system, NtrC family, response regulator GlrR
MADDDSTDLQPRADLNLTALRRRPVLEWRDARGPHAVEIDGRITLGSSEHVGAVISDRAVSRLHAELEVRSDGVWIRDLGSRNGAYIAGVLVQSAQVPLGKPFVLGNTQLQVTIASQERTVPLWPEDHYGPLFGVSETMRELFLRLAQYAATDSPVLVHGETGTGKELVAEAIHEASRRREAPFVVLDCAALPETLLESELFGHTRGSFTGATTGRTGAFEAAQGGTVFLDEIGELPLSMQPKLLRVIESLTVRRIGETDRRRVDVRFIAATHRDLQAMVAAGSFREDLYFRLAVLPVFVPPLRARRDDIPGLLAHFLSRRPDIVVDPILMEELVAHPWTGNVRELRSFVDRAVAVGPASAWALTRGEEPPGASRLPPPSSVSSVAATPPGLGTVPLDVPFKVLKERYNDQFERVYFGAMIERIGRDAPAIAAAAGLDPTYVRRLLRKHAL